MCYIVKCCNWHVILAVDMAGVYGVPFVSKLCRSELFIYNVLYLYIIYL